ncbi:uncharacterized protein LOC116199597 [Punica granatum]|uniref:C2H2-type domain-containing protein n=2 Tax=Punica granatum TaxID=22663 RepID=A0A218X8G2_PUNGR|nr:uncharacterized protein LOC116199597 [Punica granatum]OWM81234.1 hypothetical protein CDL15_Pgr007272 [Punica granatum]PKI67638.1 hypothetical protein CRG98_011851 [Punica granatum]
MPTVWFALKRSLHCKSEPSDVYDPKTRRQLAAISTSRKSSTRSGCSRSIANLKDVIHGSKRHIEKPPSCSPRSIGSSEFLNPITHEVILGGNSRCELKITSFNGAGQQDSGTALSLAPGTPMHCFNNPSFRVSTATNGSTPPRKSPAFGLFDREGHNSNSSSVLGSWGLGSLRGSQGRGSLDGDCHGNGVSVTCHKCGEQFSKWEAAEAHHLSKHAVTELVEGDSSRKIVEIICRTGWLKSEPNSARIDRVLKVHNMQKTLARFEEYRETVKIKASKLPKKHPRCLADGNELLRFYGTTLSCTLGLNGSSSLCSLDKCYVCRIIRNGFSAKKELKDGIGVFTTSTSGRAFESIEAAAEEGEEGQQQARKALIVCRVIAGRVHRPLENIHEINGQTGFDSLAGKVGLYSHIEELYLLNPRALLPCFVVICK